MNSTQNSDTSLNYPISNSNNGPAHSLVNSNRPFHNFNNGFENGQQTFPVADNNWFDKSESQLEQITNVQQTPIGHEYDIDTKKCDNNVETDDNFWADVENSEILPPESFQNDSLQNAMNNLQINDEVSVKIIVLILTVFICIH